MLLNNLDLNGSSSARVGVGIIGLGRSGLDIHARTLNKLQGFRLIRAADVSTVAVEHAASVLNCELSCDPADVMADPAVQVVVVAVQSHLHGPVGLASLRAGKHVVMEKPFASSVAEAEDLFHESASGRLLVPFHNRRFDPEVVALRGILKSGVLGPLVAARLSRQIYRRRDDWQTLREFGGGELRNWGAHMIDWCLHLFGKNLSLSGGDLWRVLSPGDAEDCFHLLFHTDAGARVEVEAMSCVTKPFPRWHVAGRFGTAISTDRRSFLVRYCDPQRLTPLRSRAGSAGPRYGVQEDLGFVEKEVFWENQDANEEFYKNFESWLRHGTGCVVSREEVLAQLRLMELANRIPVRHLAGESPEVEKAQMESNGIILGN